VSNRLRGGEYFGELLRRQSVAGLLLTETRYAAAAQIPRHSHERGYFCLVRRGRYREEYTGGQRQCGPQTLAYHPPGEWHAEQFDGSEARSFNVELTPDWARRFDAPLDRPFATRDAWVVGLGLRLYREFDHPDAASALVIEGLTLELLGHCARASLSRLRPSPPLWLEHVRTSLIDRCTEPPSLADLAREASVHPGHLAAMFRRYFGTSAGEFARRCRIDRACRMLTDTGRSLADIAIAAGFADQSHFTRCFRRQFGITPAVYRQAAIRSKT
jgi:AraC family transcriptional regulator